MLTIVLLPGMDGSGSFFPPLITALGASVKTQVISYPNEKALDYAQLTQIVEESLPKGSPFVVLGESFSGPIAVSIAATKPAGLKAIILVCSFVCSPIQIPKTFRTIASFIPVLWIPPKIVSKRLLGSYSTAEMEVRLAEALSKVSIKAWQARLLSILDVDVRTELSEIVLPIMYIRASQDKIVPKSAANLVFLNQPNTVIAEIDGPHFILQANPAASASSILKFLTTMGILK